MQQWRRRSSNQNVVGGDDVPMSAGLAMVGLLVREKHLVSQAGEVIDRSMEFLLHARPAASAPHPRRLLLKGVLVGGRSISGRAVLAALLPHAVVQHESVGRGLDGRRRGSRSEAEGRD